MAIANGTATDAVASSVTPAIASRLAAGASQYDYFQALRLLEAAHPHRPRLGEAQHPQDEFVRLEHRPSMAFAPSSTAEYEPANDDRAARLASHCFGLTGPNGPLPLHLTEYTVERDQYHGDATFRAFLDLFHHRMLSLFYRAWADAQPTVQHDRPEDDRYRVYIGSLFGMGLESQQNRDALPDTWKLHFAGRFLAPTRNAEGLEAILQSVLGIPAEVVPFDGQWLAIPEDCQLRLGQSRANGCLGQSATLGSRVWDRQSHCRVVLGPMTFQHFVELLPSGRFDQLLTDMLRQYLGDELACDVVLELQGSEVPTMQLGNNVRLGQTTWLPDRRPFTNRRDVVLRAAG
ncbi:MAG TPA: type VI secretion system baseplate subunit TssG [Planctomycetaceae bacterium]|nr:type VI secretion system baseplate subunit TssG [Planctomycetaceae bacterium]